MFLKGKFKDLQLTYYRRQDSFDGASEDLNINGATTTVSTANKIEQVVNIAGVEFDHQSDDGTWSFKKNASYADFIKNEGHCFQKIISAELNLRRFEHLNLLFGAEVRNISAGEHYHEFVGATHLQG